MKLLIQNGLVVDPINNTTKVMNLYIENGKIVSLQKDGIHEADQVIDATGLVVSPGLVDMHVHLRDPGLTHKEDIVTGCAAAARGGVTSMACMANTKPIVDSPEGVSYIRQKAMNEGCGVKVLPIAAVSKGMDGSQLTDAALLKRAGAIALSDDGVNVDSAETMRNALIQAKIVGIPILAHCEDSAMVGNRAVNEGRVSRQLWLEGRPAIAEEIVVMRDAMLARETGAPVHVCHVSTANSVAIIRAMKKLGVPITCETCPQYFTLTEDEILRQGSLARINPPLRTAKDVRGIIAGLRDGTIDAIATDHAPHAAEEKALPLERAPSGAVGLETSLAVTLTALYHTGKLDLPQIVNLMSTRPASILSIPGGGRLTIGSPADVTIFDPDEAWTVNPDDFVSKSHNTPFGGWEVKGRVKYTIVDGKIIFKDK